MEIDDDEREYCQLLRYCAKIDELEKRKEIGNAYTNMPMLWKAA